MNTTVTSEEIKAYRAEIYADAVQPYAAAIHMVRDAIEELFGPVASLESEEAVLLRGPEPHHDAEAIIAALKRVKYGRADTALEMAERKIAELKAQLPKPECKHDWEETGFGASGPIITCRKCGKVEYD